MNKVVEFRRGEIFDDIASMRNSQHLSNDDRLHTNSSAGANTLESPANFGKSNFRGNTRKF